MGIQFKRGLHANRPAAAPEGTILLSTDTKQLSVGTGDGVEQIKVDIADILRLLGLGNKIDPIWLPSIALTEIYVVPNLAARDALTDIQTGDVAVVEIDSSNDNKRQAYIYNVSAWVQMTTASDAVDSVNGQTGAVVLTTSHIAEGTNLYYTLARVNAAIDARRGAANGVGSLNVNAKVPTSELGAGAAPAFALLESDGAGQARWITEIDLGTF